jgi:hypothetical protein
MTQQVFEQAEIPTGAVQVGDVWTDSKTFKRVWSSGHAWENCELGHKHPDEPVEGDDDEQQSRAKSVGDTGEVSSRTGKSASRDGDHGKAADAASVGAETEGVDEEEIDEEQEIEEDAEDEDKKPIKVKRKVVVKKKVPRRR